VWPRPNVNTRSRTCIFVSVCRLRTTTHDYVRLRTTTYDYARLRTTTYDYVRLRTTTHDYARLRTTTHDYARLRTTTHDYVRLRTTTHDYARLRTTTYDQLGVWRRFRCDHGVKTSDRAASAIGRMSWGWNKRAAARRALSIWRQCCGLQDWSSTYGRHKSFLLATMLGLVLGLNKLPLQL
jgi:hypothetical protein